MFLLRPYDIWRLFFRVNIVFVGSPNAMSLPLANVR